MVLARVSGPFAIGGVSQDMVYGTKFMVHVESFRDAHHGLI